MNLLLRSLFLLLAGVLFFIGAGIVATWAPDQTVEELAPLWAPPPSRFVPVAGLSVHLRDEGPVRSGAADAAAGPTPVLLLHGTAASLHTWDGWAAVLREQRRVIRVDLPGFGLTGPHPQHDYSLDAYVRFVLACMDTLGLKRVVLGGNSLGGQIAWAVAHAAPERVERLVLVDAAGYPPEYRSVPIGFVAASLPPASWLMRYTLPRGLVEASVRNVWGDPAGVTPELVDRYMAMMRRAGNREALARRMAQPMAPAPERIAQIRQPTLILWGGRDRLIPPSHGQRFAREIPGSQLVVFEDLGHVPQEEDPTRTVAAVVRFLTP